MDIVTFVFSVIWSKIQSSCSSSSFQSTPLHIFVIIVLKKACQHIGIYGKGPESSASHACSIGILAEVSWVGRKGANLDLHNSDSVPGCEDAAPRFLFLLKWKPRYRSKGTRICYSCAQINMQRGTILWLVETVILSHICLSLKPGIFMTDWRTY